MSCDVLEIGKKRVEELGLNSYGIIQINPLSNNRYYLADDIHKLLGEGMEAFDDDNWSAWTPDRRDGSKNKALLIGIKPIVQESEERKLLREMVGSIATSQYTKDRVEHFRAVFNRSDCEILELISKAKRLLEEK